METHKWVTEGGAEDYIARVVISCSEDGRRYKSVVAELDEQKNMIHGAQPRAEAKEKM